MFHFPGEQENENVLEVIRKHPIVYAKILLSYFIVALMPIGILVFLVARTTGFNFRSPTLLITGIFSIFYLLLWLLYVCIAWINEQFDLFIVTDQRLIDVTQVSLFKRSISATPLEQIQDTTGTVSGLLPSLFSYGDLNIKTASGKDTEFLMDHIHDPTHRARDILNWAQAKKSGKPVVPQGGKENTEK